MEASYLLDLTYWHGLMAWHFSKVELGSQTSKMVGVERGHSEIGGRELKGGKRERERKGERESRFKWAFRLQFEGTHNSSSWATKRYVSKVLRHT